MWNYKSFVLHKLIKKMHDAAVLCCQWSVSSGYLYTLGAQEMHKCVLWNSTDLFKLDKKTGLDHDDILSADVTSKKKNFVNTVPDIVSDLLLGKQDKQLRVRSADCAESLEWMLSALVSSWPLLWM